MNAGRFRPVVATAVLLVSIPAILATSKDQETISATDTHQVLLSPKQPAVILLARISVRGADGTPQLSADLAADATQPSGSGVRLVASAADRVSTAATFTSPSEPGMGPDAASRHLELKECTTNCEQEVRVLVELTNPATSWSGSITLTATAAPASTGQLSVNIANEATNGAPPNLPAQLGPSATFPGPLSGFGPTQTGERNSALVLSLTGSREDLAKSWLLVEASPTPSDAPQLLFTGGPGSGDFEHFPVAVPAGLSCDPTADSCQEFVAITEASKGAVYQVRWLTAPTDIDIRLIPGTRSDVDVRASKKVSMAPGVRLLGQARSDPSRPPDPRLELRGTRHDGTPFSFADQPSLVSIDTCPANNATACSVLVDVRSNQDEDQRFADIIQVEADQLD